MPFEQFIDRPLC